MTMGLNDKIEARRRAQQAVEEQSGVTEVIADASIQRDTKALSLAEKVEMRRRELNDMEQARVAELRRQEEAARPPKQPQIPLRDAIEQLSTKDAIWVGVFTAFGLIYVVGYLLQDDSHFVGLFIGAILLFRGWQLVRIPYLGKSKTKLSLMDHYKHFGLVGKIITVFVVLILLKICWFFLVAALESIVVWLISPILRIHFI